MMTDKIIVHTKTGQQLVSYGNMFDARNLVDLDHIILFGRFVIPVRSIDYVEVQPG